MDAGFLILVLLFLWWVHRWLNRFYIALAAIDVSLGQIVKALSARGGAEIDAE